MPKFTGAMARFFGAVWEKIARTQGNNSGFFRGWNGVIAAVAALLFAIKIAVDQIEFVKKLEEVIIQTIKEDKTLARYIAVAVIASALLFIHHLLKALHA